MAKRTGRFSGQVNLRQECVDVFLVVAPCSHSQFHRDVKTADNVWGKLGEI